MQRFLRNFILACLFIFGLAQSATAQNVVPEFRYLGSQDTDFYGSDLDVLFDTDLISCVRACTNNRNCTDPGKDDPAPV